jgi:predicted MFS family arabinose efflux permease
MTADQPAVAGSRVTYTDLLRVRGVTALFGVALTHVLGTSLQIFALSVFVYAETGSALWSSTAFAAGFLPQLIGGALLTSLSDRLPPRALLASGALARATSAFALALGNLSPAWAIATVAVVAVWQPVPMAAQSALLTRLVTGDRYVLGRSVLNLIGSGAQLLGLAAGGAAVQWLGTSAAFGAAGALQLLGLLVVSAIPATGTAPAVAERWSLRETWRGNGELLRDRVVRHILLSWWLAPTLLVGAEALVVAYMGERGQSAAPTGLLLAAFPTGAAVGDLVVGRLFSADLRRRSTPWLFALVGVPLLPLTLHPGLTVTWLCFALASAGIAYQLGGQQAFLAAVPEAQRGLAFGLFGTGLMGGQGLGPVVAGGLADIVGAGTTMSLLGAVVLLAATRYGPLPSQPDR